MGFFKRKKEEKASQQYVESVNEQYNVVNIDYSQGYASLPKQTVEDKLNELKKMDHVQFEFFVSNIYRLKGCSVKLTPVVDNFGIDMIVELHGHTTGVRCILTDKILTRKIIDDTLTALHYYPIMDVTIVTNGYFDADAVKYQRNNQAVALVDKDLLIENFLKYKPAPTPKNTGDNDDNGQ